MLMLPPSVRIFVCLAPADMRRSLDGLAAMTREIIREDPLSGHLFVFFNRRRNRTKIAVVDGLIALKVRLAVVGLAIRVGVGAGLILDFARIRQLECRPRSQSGGLIAARRIAFVAGFALRPRIRATHDLAPSVSLAYGSEPVKTAWNGAKSARSTSVSASASKQSQSRPSPPPGPDRQPARSW